jgi:hypothetical protein
MGTTLLLHFAKVFETEFLKATFLLERLPVLHISCVSARVYLGSVGLQSNAAWRQKIFETLQFDSEQMQLVSQEKISLFVTT